MNNTPDGTDKRFEREAVRHRAEKTSWAALTLQLRAADIEEKVKDLSGAFTEAGRVYGTEGENRHMPPAALMDADELAAASRALDQAGDAVANARRVAQLIRNQANDTLRTLDEEAGQ